jgi:hypothetical protein
VVHGREQDGRTDEFGVSGYVYRDVFLMFDRRTESLWYPLTDGEWTAIAGPRKGETIPFAAQPAPMPLAEWRKLHPGTVVLLGSRAAIERTTTRPASREPRSHH